MSSDERALSELVERGLPWPTQMEFVASRDRVLDQLRATADRRATALRAATALPLPTNAGNSRLPVRPWALGLAAVAVIVVWTGLVWPRSFSAFTRITILESFLKGMAQTAGRPVPEGRQGNTTVAQRPAEVREFEEASIRRCDPENLPEAPPGGRGGGANSVQMTPGRLNALCMTIATLIRTAYGYSPLDLDFNRNGRMIPMDVGSVYGLGEEDGRRVRGGPDWIRSERYTIEAVAGAGTSPNAEAMRGPMLQRLLEHRLRLRAHIEAEQVPAYLLTVARGGLKMKPVLPDACQPLEARPGSGLQFGHPTSVLTVPPTPDDVRRGAKPGCGPWAQRVGPNMVFVAGDVPIEALVQLLAFRLGGVRVLDKTGVTERFNFFLEFALDENAPGRRGAEPPPPSSDDARAATIFTALEEQLGLKLEQTRTPREFIVIDAIERPGPN